MVGISGAHGRGDRAHPCGQQADVHEALEVRTADGAVPGAEGRLADHRVPAVEAAVPLAVERIDGRVALAQECGQRLARALRLIDGRALGTGRPDPVPEIAHAGLGSPWPAVSGYVEDPGSLPANHICKPGSSIRGLTIFAARVSNSSMWRGSNGSPMRLREKPPWSRLPWPSASAPSSPRGATSSTTAEGAPTPSGGWRTM
jgi:hypothetical protein